MSTTTVLPNVVKYGPVLLAMAESIYQTVRDAVTKRGKSTEGTTSESISMSSIAERLSRLETNELQQAELDSKIARQVSDITAVLQTVSTRALVSLLLAGVALLASLVSIILTLIK